MPNEYIPLVAAAIAAATGLIAAMAGVTGALLGALANNLLAARNDRLKWARDNEIRYNPQRLELYARYATRGAYLVQVIATGGLSSEEREALVAEFTAMQYEVVLFAHAAAQQAARLYWRAIVIGLKQAVEREPDTPEGAATVSRYVGEAIRRQYLFLEAARAELKLHGPGENALTPTKWPTPADWPTADEPDFKQKAEANNSAGGSAGGSAPS